MTGTACSGRGAPFLAQDGRVLCVCDADWLGGADLFDQVVSTAPDGTPLLLDCLVPTVGIRAVWALNLFFCLYHLVYSLIGIRGLVKSRKRAKHINFAVLLIDLCVFLPLCISAACIKIAYPLDVFGTDIPLTLIFFLGVYVNIINFSVFEVEEFKALLSAHLMSSNSLEFIRQVDRFKLQQGLVVLSFAANVAATFAALGMDKSVGPIESKEWIIIILRNVFVVMWQVNLAYSSFILHRNLKKQLGGLASSSDKGKPNPPVGSAQSRAQQVVSFLANSAKSNLRRSIGSMGIYTVFSIPPLWPYQSFVIGLTMIIMLISMNPGKILYHAQRAGKEIVSTPSPGVVSTRLAKQENNGPSHSSGSFLAVTEPPSSVE